MLLHLTDLSAEPLHRQIFAQIYDKILVDDLVAGTELISARALARQHHVNANAVERAYWELAREGVIVSQDGKTFFVAALTPEQKQNLQRRRLQSHHYVQGQASNMSIAVALEQTRLDEDLHRARQLQNGLSPKRCRIMRACKRPRTPCPRISWAEIFTITFPWPRSVSRSSSPMLAARAWPRRF